MPNSIDYHIKNIRRKLLLLTAAMIHIDNLDKRRKYIEIIEELQDTDLMELESAIKANGTRTNK